MYSVLVYPLAGMAHWVGRSHWVIFRTRHTFYTLTTRLTQALLPVVNIDTPWACKGQLPATLLHWKLSGGCVYEIILPAGCLEGCAPWKSALVCVVCRSYFVHSTKWRSLKERCFHRLSKAPRNFNQTDVRVLFGAGAQTNAVILARSESKDQRHCYVSVDTTFYGNWSSSKAATLPSYHLCVKWLPSCLYSR